MILEDKVVLITGGTGSLGQALVDRIMLGENGLPKKIIIFSRDEDKQYLMKLRLANVAVSSDDITYRLPRVRQENISFVIGDVRSYESISGYVDGSDIIIHAAALKQVPICEYFPNESIMTNITGAQNIVRAVELAKHKPTHVIATSTDKACDPINVYGMCKAVQERVMVEANMKQMTTKFICVRYGNVIRSRGSVIPLFQEQIQNGGPLTITSPDMTRFLIPMSMAVDTIMDSTILCRPGEILVPKLGSTKITDLVNLLIGYKGIGTEVIGVRPGERIHELLISDDEAPRSFETDNYYIIRPILPELLEPIRSDHRDNPHLGDGVSSDQKLMSTKELKTLLKAEGIL